MTLTPEEEDYLNKWCEAHKDDPCPKWMEFLGEIHNNDPDAVAISAKSFQRAMGPAAICKILQDRIAQA